jgi:hypothetical protein
MSVRRLAVEDKPVSGTEDVRAAQQGRGLIEAKWGELLRIIPRKGWVTVLKCLYRSSAEIVDLHVCIRPCAKNAEQC